MPPPLVVSACLLGRACRYDGASKPATAVQDLAERWSSAGGAVIPVCPEELGGLGTPRPGAHLTGGDGHAVLEGRARVVRAEDGVFAALLRRRGVQVVTDEALGALDVAEFVTKL